MPSDQDEVPADAVIAAMELVKGLGDNENAMPGDELLRLIRDASVTPEELTQGFALLISSFMHLLDGPMDLVPPVIRKLRALELVPEEVLPTMAGALTAAALGQSPLRWRHALQRLALPGDSAVAVQPNESVRDAPCAGHVEDRTEEGLHPSERRGSVEPDQSEQAGCGRADHPLPPCGTSRTR